MRRRRLTFGILMVAAASLLAPTPASAQDAAVDSLRAEVRALRATIDSLLQVLRTLQEEDARRQTQTEIERLRAAAAAAAAAAARQGQAPTEDDQQFIGKGRSQQILNPEISIAGDVVGFADSDGEKTIIPREFEFAFQAAIDPFARTKIFITHEEEIPLSPVQEEGEEEGSVVEIEEAYAYWVGLPGGFSLDVGKFRQAVGVLNKYHTHALPEIERPLALREIIGQEGLIQTGASAYWLAPFSGAIAYEFWFQAAATQSEILFPEASSISFLGRANVFREIGSSSYIQLGATGLYGQDEDADALRTRLAGLDITYNWQPPSRAIYRQFTLRAELLWADQRIDASTGIARGGYGAAYYRLGRRWNAGFRFDFLDPFEGDEEQWQTVATLTWSQSEFLRVRGQWNHLDIADSNQDQFLIQLSWAVGPHRDEIY